jgi:MFS family permease
VSGSLDATRRRLLGVLFASSALTRTGFIATITVASLVAEDLLGSATLAGLPAATATIGVAVGTTPIAVVMRRYGRRIGIAGGHLWAAGGAAVAALAVNLGWFPLFVVGMFLFGFGNAGDRLSRYAAGDVATAERRSFAISVVVWAGTIGSVVGPALLEPVEDAATALGLEGLSGPPLLAVAALVIAAAVIASALRPDPLTFVEHDGDASQQALPLRPLLRQPSVRFAIVALIIGQVVMVLIMTMTPVHIRRAGEDLGIVGLVISAHTLGMFAVSPLTGILADRIGRIPVIVAGEAILVLSAVMSATAGGDERTILVVSLFLLGLGWNFGFVAGSAYLTEGVPAAARIPLQGVADAVVWTSSAAASLSSGFLLELSGYPVLSIIGAALVAIPVVAYLRLRPRVAALTSRN